MEHYHVRVCGDELVFSAAHFITLGDEVCEALHGHDYRVAAEVHGPLGENHYVFDFVALHDALKAVLAELDHHVLLPTGHPQIRVEAGDREIEVTFGERRWVFPRPDCLLLPVANTTAELLARHIGRRLAGELEARSGIRPLRLRIEVGEGYGRSAVCELGEGGQ
jgi:6-pyruvoyltetrahydropterin/6-carboxytetrahydropterin synthase